MDNSLSSNPPKFNGSPESAFIYRSDIPKDEIPDLLGLLIERARTITGVLSEENQGTEDYTGRLVRILDGTLSQLETMIDQEITNFFYENTQTKES